MSRGAIAASCFAAILVILTDSPVSAQDANADPCPSLVEKAARSRAQGEPVPGYLDRALKANNCVEGDVEPPPPITDDGLQQQVDELKRDKSTLKARVAELEDLLEDARAKAPADTHGQTGADPGETATLQRQIEDEKSKREGLLRELESARDYLAEVVAERDALMGNILPPTEVFEGLLAERVKRFEDAVTPACDSSLSFRLASAADGVSVTLNGEVVDDEVYRNELQRLEQSLGGLDLINEIETSAGSLCTGKFGEFTISVNSDGRRPETVDFDSAKEAVDSLPALKDCEAVGGAFVASRYYENLENWPLGFWSLTNRGVIGVCRQDFHDGEWQFISLRPKGEPFFLIHKAEERQD